MLRQELKKSCDVNNDIMSINTQMQEMASSITDQILPQTEKIMNLKKHAMDLHQKLGATQLQSAYHTLLEAREFESLGPIVSGMVQEGQRNAASNAAQEEPAKTEQVYQAQPRHPSSTSDARASQERRSSKRTK